MDPFTVLALAIVAALVVIPFVVIEVKRRRRRAADDDDADSMRNLLALAIPVLSPAELRASEQAKRLQRERTELDDEAPLP